MNNPSLQQKTFRGRNDDVALDSSSFTHNTNTNWTQAADTTFRVRFVIQETGNAATASTNFQFQYSLDGGTFATIGTATSVVRAFSSSQYSNGASTTQLLDGTGTFVAGRAPGTNSSTGEITVDALGNSEFEFCGQIRSADVSDGSKVRIRMAAVSGTAIATYTNSPEITAVVAAVNGGGGTVAGIASAAGTGDVVKSGAGAGVAFASAAATGYAAHFGDGAISASAAATGTGQAPAVVMPEGAGTASGIASANGTGQAEAYGFGAISAIASVTAAGEADAYGAGVVNALAGTTGQGYAEAYGTGTVTGIGIATGTGEATEVGVNSGAGTVTAIGSATAIGHIEAAGYGTITAIASVTGTGQAPTVGVSEGAGSSLGIASASGQGEVEAFGAGEISAIAAANGTGQAPTVGAPGEGAGTITVVGSADAVGYSLRYGSGGIAGVAGVDATGYSLYYGSGIIAGIANAVGFSLTSGPRPTGTLGFTLSHGNRLISLSGPQQAVTITTGKTSVILGTK